MSFNVCILAEMYVTVKLSSSLLNFTLSIPPSTKWMATLPPKTLYYCFNLGFSVKNLYKFDKGVYTALQWGNPRKGCNPVT